jgi:hypothetical protein
VDAADTAELGIQSTRADVWLQRDQSETRSISVWRTPGAAGRFASHHSHALVISRAARRVTLTVSGVTSGS